MREFIESIAAGFIVLLIALGTALASVFTMLFVLTLFCATSVVFWLGVIAVILLTR